jgi:hypothetical protein
MKKKTRGANGMLRIISEQTSEIDEELCSSFIDWQKTSGFVNWKKIKADPKGKWQQLAQKKTDQQTVCGSQC